MLSLFNQDSYLSVDRFSMHLLDFEICKQYVLSIEHREPPTYALRV